MTEGTDDSRLHYLTANSYKLEVDTAALFSVLFVSKQTFNDYDASDLKYLNYTFLGDEQMLQYQGVWTDVRMTIPKTTGDTEDTHKLDVTIFVALGDAPDAGLDGTLSLTMLPDSGSWSNVSTIKNTKGLPMIYISYLYTE